MFMPGAPPSILSPGRGPNGPGPIDARKPITSVGIGTSSVPYGPTNGYAAGDTGVKGFVGPAIGSLQQPTSWYVRVGGSNDNGGSSNSLTPERTGTDGSVNLTDQLTSASANFTFADIGKGVCIGTGTGASRFKIIGIISSTIARLDRTANNLSGQTWAIGGAWADCRAAIGDIAVSQNANGQGSAVNAGDTVYIGAGTYRNIMAITRTVWGKSNNVVTSAINRFFPQFNGYANFVGDVTGQYTGDAGPVIFTAFTTNDKTAPSASSLISLGGTGNMAFSNIMFVGGLNTTAGVIESTTANPAAQNMLWTDCAFHDGAVSRPQIALVSRFGVGLHWKFNRCYFMQGNSNTNNGILLTLPRGATADYDADFRIENSCVLSMSPSRFLLVSSSGAGAKFGGGAILRNVFGYSRGSILATSDANESVIFPCQLVNSFIYGGGTSLAAFALGQITEDFNFRQNLTNVTAGPNSIGVDTYAPLFHYGQERIWASPNGVPLFKPMGEPMQNSPMLGFGSKDPIGAYPDPADLLALARPAGIASPLAAAGALERHNNWIPDPAPIGTSSTPIKFTGPGDQAFIVPVPASAITITVKVAWDATYQGTKPQLQLDSNESIGVDAQTVTAVGSGGVETLTLAAFTPTASGKQVVVRVRSNDLTGAAVVQADDFTVTG